jgi:cytochrome c peroxidase
MATRTGIKDLRQGKYGIQIMLEGKQNWKDNCIKPTMMHLRNREKRTSFFSAGVVSNLKTCVWWVVEVQVKLG